MDDIKLWSLLLGAALGLLAAIVVQAVIIPWVQWSSRQRVRWERYVEELSDLLDDQFPKSLSKMRWDAHAVLMWERLMKSDDVDRAAVRKELRAAQDEGQESREAAQQDLKRIRLLLSRIKRRRASANLWAVLLKHELQLVMANWEVDLSRPKSDQDDTEMEAWNEKWKELESERKSLATALEPVVVSMRAPRTYPLKRARKKVWSVAASVGQRLRRKTAPEVSEVVAPSNESVLTAGEVATPPSGR